jgi:hypothetical protein
MAVGKAGEKADPDKLAIRIGGVAVALDGAEAPGYDEAPVAKHLAGGEVTIEVDVGVGRGRGTGVDLRPDARLHRHQCQLPHLKPGAGARRRRRPPAQRGSFWSWRSR